MLDSDLAQLYHCANGTKTINQVVNRYQDRFPKDFYFQLTLDECSKFQVGTLNNIENDSRSQVGTLKVKLGTSINHAGRRTFIINKLNDQIILDTLLKKVSDTY